MQSYAVRLVVAFPRRCVALRALIGDFPNILQCECVGHLYGLPKGFADGFDTPARMVDMVFFSESCQVCVEDPQPHALSGHVPGSLTPLGTTQVVLGLPLPETRLRVLKALMLPCAVRAPAVDNLVRVPSPARNRLTQFLLFLRYLQTSR